VAYLNENYLKLQAGYLFPEIARRVREFCEKDPNAAERLIRCGIGDVTEPLPQAAIKAINAPLTSWDTVKRFAAMDPSKGTNS